MLFCLVVCPPLCFYELTTWCYCMCCYGGFEVGVGFAGAEEKNIFSWAEFGQGSDIVSAIVVIICSAFLDFWKLHTSSKLTG